MCFVIILRMILCLPAQSPADGNIMMYNRHAGNHEQQDHAVFSVLIICSDAIGVIREGRTGTPLEGG